MLSTKPVGRSASVVKYDVLTALGVYALSQSKHEQRLVLRFITLITARYNWARDELAVGQREIGQMWSVDTRTVKREMAKLRALGWLVVKRHGARGRVAEYGIDLDAIRARTEPAWAHVGPDFDLRMRGAPAQPENIVRLPVKGEVAPPVVTDGTEWSLAQALLYQEDAGLYSAWLRTLTRDQRVGGRLILRAPSRFHGSYVSTHLLRHILTAVQGVDADVSDVSIIV